MSTDSMRGDKIDCLAVLESVCEKNNDYWLPGLGKIHPCKRYVSQNVYPSITPRYDFLEGW